MIKWGVTCQITWYSCFDDIEHVLRTPLQRRNMAETFGMKLVEVNIFYKKFMFSGDWSTLTLFSWKPIKLRRFPRVFKWRIVFIRKKPRYEGDEYPCAKKRKYIFRTPFRPSKNLPRSYFPFQLSVRFYFSYIRENLFIKHISLLIIDLGSWIFWIKLL